MHTATPIIINRKEETEIGLNEKSVKPKQVVGYKKIAGKSDHVLEYISKQTADKIKRENNNCFLSVPASGFITPFVFHIYVPLITPRLPLTICLPETHNQTYTMEK